MAKDGIHPEWYPESQVFCNGEHVMTVGSTRAKLQVDVWSGNHPFYTGTQKTIDTEGRIQRFRRKYGMTDVEMPQVDASSGPLKMEDPPAEAKPAGKDKKKK